MKNIVTKFRHLIILLVIVIFMSIVSDAFLSFSNIINVIWSVCTVGIIAVFGTFVILTGKIDLSVGSITAMSGIITVTCIAEQGWPIAAAIIAGILAGGVIGVINGLLVTKTKVPDFIVTFSVSYILIGISQALTHGGKTISAIAYKNFTFLGNGKIFEIPIPIFILIAAFIVGFILIHLTTYGRRCYLCGGNASAASLSGISPIKTIFLAYVLTGIAAGISGVVLSALTQQANSSLAMGYELDVIAAVVIGGTLMSGGVGDMTGTLFGVLLVGLIDNGMNLLGLPGTIESVVKGVIIIAAVALNNYFVRRKVQKKPTGHVKLEGKKI